MGIRHFKPNVFYIEIKAANFDANCLLVCPSLVFDLSNFFM